MYFSKNICKNEKIIDKIQIPDRIPEYIINRILIQAICLINKEICDEIKLINYVKKISIQIWGSEIYNDFLDYAQDLFDGCPSFVNFKSKKKI